MAESIKLPKPKYGQIVVLQKNGEEPRGHGFPLVGQICVIGRCETADIRVSSADVSLIHCKLQIDEASGEASLEILGNETQVNEAVVDPVTTIKLNHKDVIMVGGRRLRFEYLPPDYKPVPGKVPSVDLSDSLKAEVVDREENGDVVDINSEKEEEETVPVPCTPSGKRVSFGPYLSPEQFDNTLPPATPIKKGATPRRSTRYSGLKFTRPNIDPLIEEDAVTEIPTQEDQSVKEDRLFVEDSIISEDQEATSVTSIDETANDSPSLALPAEYPDVPTPANVDISSIDAMSTMSDVSNIAVVPSECCSFLDEPIEEDFGPEVSEHDSLSQLEDPAMYDTNEDLMSTENVQDISTVTSPINGVGSLTPLSTTTSRLEETVGEEDEEGITLSPEDMSEKNNDQSLNEDQEQVKESVKVEEKESRIPFKTPSSPQADYTDVRGVKQLMQTPKPVPSTPKADYINVVGVKELLKTPKNPKNPKNPDSPQADYTNVDGVKKLLETPKPPQKNPEPDYTDVDGVQDLLKTPKAASSVKMEEEKSPAPETPKTSETNGSKSSKESRTPSPEKSPQPASKSIKVVDYAESSPEADCPDVQDDKQPLQKPNSTTPKADYTNVEGVKKLLETPKPAPESPKADYSDVDGVKQLLETPKPKVVVASATVSPQADYSDVCGVKQLLQTPKPPPSTPKADYRDVRGIKRLLRTPKAAGTPKADYTDVEGVDRLMMTPKAEKEEEIVEIVVEEVLEVAESDSGCLAPSQETDVVETVEVVTEPTDDQVVIEEKPVVETKEKEESESEEEVAKPVNTPRRGGRAAPTPQTKTPKPRSKRNQPEPENQEEKVAETPKEPAVENVEAEIPKDVTEPEEVPSTPRRGRRTVPTPKINTPRLAVKRKPSDAECVPEEKVETQKTSSVVEPKEEAPPQEVEAEEVDNKPNATPRRGPRAAPTPKQSLKRKPSDAESAPEDASEVEKEGKPAVGEEAEKVEEEESTDSSVKLSKTPRRGRRITEPKAKTDTPKPRAKRTKRQSEESEESESIEEKNVPEKIPAAVEEEVEPIAEDQSSTTTEVIMEDQPAEEMVQPAAETPRQGRRIATPRTKMSGPKSRSKQSKHQSEESEETESIEKKDVVPEKIPATVEEEVEPISEDPSSTITEEVVKSAAESPRQGRRITGPSGKTTKRQSEEAEDAVPEEIPAVVEEEVEPITEDKSSTTPEEVVKSDVESPRQGRRITGSSGKTDTPKPRANRTKRQSEESEDAVPEEIPAVVEEVEPITEDPSSTIPEEVVKPADETPRQGSRTATPKTKMSGPKSRSKRQSEESEEAESIEKKDVPDEILAAVEEEVEPIAEDQSSTTTEDQPAEETVQPAAETPRRARRTAAPKTKISGPKPRSKQSKLQSDSESHSEETESTEDKPATVEQEEDKETTAEEQVVPVAVTPRRGRRAAAPKPESRPKRTKRQSDSDAGQPEEAEPTVKESRPVRSKRRKDDEEEAVPVVRLTRCQVPVEPPSQNTPGSPKATKKRAGSSSATKEDSEVKPVRRGRGRTAKVAEPEGTPSVDSSVEEAPRRTNARRAKTASTPVIDASEDSGASDAEPKKTSRRTAAKRNVLVDKLEAVPAEKKRRVLNKPGLDDVEMLHEGKGHASDIHAHHTPEEEEEEEEEKGVRTTRSKKALKVHFDTVSSPARTTRSKKAPVAPSVSPQRRQVSVRLQRDPEIETLAAASVQDEDDGAKTVKRGRTKRTTTPAQQPVSAAVESPAKPTKRSRGKKAEADPAESSPPPAPSPRRTRRTRI